MESVNSIILRIGDMSFLLEPAYANQVVLGDYYTYNAGDEEMPCWDIYKCKEERLKRSFDIYKVVASNAEKLIADGVHKLQAIDCIDADAPKCYVCGYHHNELRSRGGKTILDPTYFIDNRISEIMQEKSCCFECAFWYEKIELHDDKTYIIDGSRYHDSGSINGKVRSFGIGHGGVTFYIKTNDNKFHSTNNLANQGTIPRSVKQHHLLKNNAVFIEPLEYYQNMLPECKPVMAISIDEILLGMSFVAFRYVEGSELQIAKLIPSQFLASIYEHNDTIELCQIDDGHVIKPGTYFLQKSDKYWETFKSEEQFLAKYKIK